MKRLKLSYLVALTLATSLLTQSVTAYAAETVSKNSTSESTETVVSETASTESEEAVTEENDDLNGTAIDSPDKPDENAEEESGSASETTDDDTSQSPIDATSEDLKNTTGVGGEDDLSHSASDAPVKSEQELLEKQGPETTEPSSAEESKALMTVDKTSTESTEQQDDNEETRYPAFTCERTTNDSTTVQVKAPEGAFPEGIQLNVTHIKSEQVVDDLENATNIDINVEDILAYDFDFYLGDEHDIEPKKEIQVTFSGLGDFLQADESSEEELKSDPEIQAFHIDDEENVEEKTDVQVDPQQDSVSVGVDQFSIVALYRASLELMAEKEAIMGEMQLKPSEYWVNYGQSMTTTPREVNLNDEWSGTDTPSRSVVFTTFSTVYSSNIDQNDNNGFIDYMKAKNIVKSDQADSCIIQVGSSFILKDDNLQNELIAWSDQNDLGWNDATEINDVSATITMETDYLDSNGKPADFLRERIGDEPSINISNLIAARDSTITEGNTISNPGMLKKQYKLSWDNSTSYTLSDISSIYMDTTDHTISDPSYVTFKVCLNKFNPDYTGILQIRPFFTIEYKFTVGDQPYDITFYTPDCTRSYEVVEQSTEPQYFSASDADLKATVTHNGDTSDLMTEHDKVTAVQHGDEITYQIDASSEAEAQVIYHCYLDMYPMGKADVSDTVGQKLHAYGIEIEKPYSNGWSQPVTDYLVFELTIPKGLKYDETKKDEIELQVVDEDNSDDLIFPWKLQDVSDSMKAVEIVHNEDGSTTIQCIATLNIPYVQPGSHEKKDVYYDIKRLLDEKVTLSVPGITVSQDAKIGTYYTAKAKVYGSFYYPYQSIESIDGSSGLIGAKPSTPTTGDDWDDDITGWEDDDEPEFQTQAASSSQHKAAAKPTKVLSYTSIPDYSDDPELNAKFPYPPDDSLYWLTGPDDQGADMLLRIPNMNYAWNHLQNEEGRDVIQSAEEALETKELWYTVVIPAATISKDIWDDAPEAERDKEFTFGIQLKDNDLFGQTFEAARGVKQDDGSVSCSNAAETVTFDAKGYAEIKLKPGEVLAIGLPDGCEYTVKEILEDETYKVEYRYVSASGDETVITGTYSNNAGIDGKLEAAKYTESDSVDVIDITGKNYPADHPDDHDTPDNPSEPGTWAIKVNKVWANDDPSTRPSSVQIQLYKNDQAYGNPVILTENGGWSYTWNNLEANQKYTVAEVNVPEGYHSTTTSKKSVWTVTNTKVPVAENTSNTSDTSSGPKESEGQPFIGTGDDSAAGLWLMLMVASAGVLLAMVAKKRRNGR